MVIIDSPPAAVVADALLIAPHADCVLYVVGVGIVDSENMRNTAGALAAAAPKMLAYFVNRVPRLLGEPASYSYAGYGRTTFAPPFALPPAMPPVPADGAARSYQATRTVVLERQPEGGFVSSPLGSDAPPRPEDALNGQEASGAHGANGSHSTNGSHGTNGTHAALRVVPRTGSVLTALDGPYFGQSFVLSPSKSLTLGGRPDCDIVLARDETISQVHAHLAPEYGGFTVYDVSSTNGTLVNDEPVSRHALEVGDVLQLGTSKFRYE